MKVRTASMKSTCADNRSSRRPTRGARCDLSSLKEERDTARRCDASPRFLTASSLVRGGVAALLLVSLSGCQLFFWGEKVDLEVIAAPTRIREAEQLREAGEPKKALLLYEEHIAARAKNPKRHADENPSFYYLFVGDT